MKKITKFTFLRKLLAIFVSITLIVGAVKAYEITHPSTVFAVGDLAVNWGVPEGDPIFTVANMAPGDVEAHTVNVVNNASSPRPVGVRGVWVSETGNLSTVLDLVISDGVTDLYTNTLAQFFTDSAGPDGIPLTMLGPGAAANYTFMVTFNSSAGNEFQETSVVFDLKIGIAIDVPDECNGINLLSTPIFGTQNGDVLTGTPGNDLIFGFEGGDVINGNNGDDCIVGGQGGDSIRGNNGSDVIFGNEGGDSLQGNNGEDLLIGGEGGDAIQGGDKNDRIFGNEDSDSLDGGNGDDYIEGNDGHDSINGGNGHDTISAGAGIDSVDAGAGNDYVEGNEGDDYLRGRNGTDRLIGGPGNDVARGDAGIDTCEAEAKNTCEL